MSDRECDLGQGNAREEKKRATDSGRQESEIEKERR